MWKGLKGCLDGGLLSVLCAASVVLPVEKEILYVGLWSSYTHPDPGFRDGFELIPADSLSTRLNSVVSEDYDRRYRPHN